MERKDAQPANETANPHAGRGSVLIDFRKANADASTDVMMEIGRLIARPNQTDPKTGQAIMQAPGQPAIDPKKEKKLEEFLKTAYTERTYWTKKGISKFLDKAKALAKEFEPGNMPLVDVITSDSLEGKGVIGENQMLVRWQGLFDERAQESLLLTFSEDGVQRAQTGVLSWDRGTGHIPAQGGETKFSGFLKKMGLDEVIAEANQENAVAREKARRKAAKQDTNTSLSF